MPGPACAARIASWRRAAGMSGRRSTISRHRASAPSRSPSRWRASTCSISVSSLDQALGIVVGRVPLLRRRRGGGEIPERAQRLPRLRRLLGAHQPAVRGAEQAQLAQQGLAAARRPEATRLRCSRASFARSYSSGSGSSMYFAAAAQHAVERGPAAVRRRRRAPRSTAARGGRLRAGREGQQAPARQALGRRAWPARRARWARCPRGRPGASTTARPRQAGRVEDQRHAQRRLVGEQAVRPLAVLAEALAVVGGDDHQRVVGAAASSSGARSGSSAASAAATSPDVGLAGDSARRTARRARRARGDRRDGPSRSSAGRPPRRSHSRAAATVSTPRALGKLAAGRRPAPAKRSS